MAAAAAFGRVAARGGGTPSCARWPGAQRVGGGGSRRLLWLVDRVAHLGARRSLTRRAPPTPGPVSGVATLVSDPESIFGAVRAEARLGHHRVELMAPGTAGTAPGRRSRASRFCLREPSSGSRLPTDYVSCIAISWPGSLPTTSSWPAAAPRGRRATKPRPAHAHRRSPLPGPPTTRAIHRFRVSATIAPLPSERPRDEFRGKLVSATSPRVG